VIARIALWPLFCGALPFPSWGQAEFDILPILRPMIFRMSASFCEMYETRVFDVFPHYSSVQVSRFVMFVLSGHSPSRWPFSGRRSVTQPPRRVRFSFRSNLPSSAILSTVAFHLFLPLSLKLPSRFVLAFFLRSLDQLWRRCFTS